MSIGPIWNPNADKPVQIIHAAVSHTFKSTRRGLLYATVLRCPDLRAGDLTALDWTGVEITCPSCRRATPDDPLFFVVRLNGRVLERIARRL